MDEIMKEQPYKVMARTDEAGRVTAINSNAFVQETEGWTQIAEGYGDKYHHAQGNYLPLPLMDERGIYRYKLADGAIVERTAEEMDADYTEPEQKPTIETRVENVETATGELQEALEMLLSGVTE